MIKLVAIFIFIVREIIKSAKEGKRCWRRQKKRTNTSNSKSSITYSIADPNERLVDLLRLVISMKQKQNKRDSRVDGDERDRRESN